MRPPKFRRNGYIGRRVMAFPTFSNMAAVRHREFFVILDHPRSQPCGPTDVSKFGIDQIFDVGDNYDFMILLVWLENA